MSRVGIGVLATVLAALVAALSLGVWPRVPATSLPASRFPRAVTSTPILYSLTAQILGGRGSITNLVPPGSSPETYTLRPRDAEELTRADMLVIVGLGFEQFLERAIADVETRGATIIRAGEHVETVGTPPNPHVWLDPLRAQEMVRAVAEGLATVDPTYAESYRWNAERTAEELGSLDAEFRTRLSSLPEHRFIAFHPAWAYFAERYGLEQVAVIEEAPGKEPTAQQLAQIVALIRASGVRALLSEPQFSPRIVEALAADLGLAVQEVNPEGGELEPGGYERLMRANVDAFVRALSGSE